ncbi:MAG TPA: ABC transporter substrate-binding protein [Gaiellaceae bacterium]|jgi:NitT/TauT family transport system substrate-binding protein|nr:ABC transporter substrate-binding protein [Gaiellaceae bacterium]
MEGNLEDAFAGEVTRRDFLRRTAAAGVGLSALSGLRVASALGAAAATQTVRWISPRGTLDVMDDFNLWVPIKMGYFKKLGINAKLIAGPIGDALATTKFVAQNQADMGYPSPGVLTASIDSGIGVKSIWDMISGQVFDFALPQASSVSSVRDLSGKKIALGSAGWSTIVDPILVEAGVDPKSVTYVNAGNQWAQSVESGQADAGLAWEGLRAQWAGQGLKLKYLIGTKFSKQPSNVYSVRASDLSDKAKVALYTRFLQGMIMGLEFARANPRAAAQITYSARPALQKSLKPQAAYDSFLELATAYGTSNRQGKGWGWNPPAGWASYLEIVHNLGQTKKQLAPSDVYTNALAVVANRKADKKTAMADAKKFKLSATWQKVNPRNPNI